MATTITRQAMTDDSGTPAAPNADGTVINKAFFDTFMDNIDSMWSGGTQVFDGVMSVGGLGTHSVSASGTGANTWRIRNTAAGTSNRGLVQVMGDGASGSHFEHYSSTFTTSGYQRPSGSTVVCFESGGLYLAANHASGILRGYAGGSTKYWEYDGDTVILNAGVLGSYGVGGVLHDSVDLGSDGTPASTTETTLKTYTLPAGALAVNNQGIRIVAFGSVAANANQKIARLKFGATEIAQGNWDGSSTSAHGWRLSADVWRTGAATQKAQGVNLPHLGANMSDLSRADLHAYTEPAETLSGTVAIVCTGENGTASANDLVCEGFYVEYLGGA